ncbi:MAG: hypothetical protein ACREV1_00905, partial [Gammaproteobacteria bacterium]
MSTVQAQNYATMRETPFAVQAVKLAQLSVVLEPQFSQLESAKLETDPAQAIRSEGDQRWQTLAGWLGSLILNDPEKPRLSCRKACFTAWLDASGFASDIALLPFGAQSPSAELVYTTGNGPSLRHKLQSLLDVNQHFLRLDLPFESSPVGRALYDEIFGAMTNPASEIAIEVSYSHQFQVPGFSANPAVSATAINDNRPVFVRNQTTGVTKAQPMASRAAPQDHATVQPAAMRFQAADVERADFQREAVMVRRPVDREVVEEPDISPS